MVGQGGRVYMDQSRQDSCRMCGNPIPRERRQRWIWAVTCERQCSDANAAELGRRARREYKRRRRAQSRQEKS